MSDSTEAQDLLRFERLHRLLLDVNDLDRFLGELARVATTVVAADVSCGITLRYDASVLTVGSSDHRAELLDETQYRNDGGPCLHSVRTGETVLIPDVLREPRWPWYTAEATRTGLRCSLSLPLTIAGETFGAMNVYGFDVPDLFGPVEQRQLEVFAAQAAGTLRVATRQAKDKTLLAQMEESLRSRTVIDQALGIIMSTQRCTAETAFEVLRQQSQNSHRRLREVAGELIERTSGGPVEPGRAFDPS